MNLEPVPKPRDAGKGEVGVVITKQAFVNVRSGPGIEYEDIGDLRDFSMVVYYPQTRAKDNWIWVEHRGVKGWVSGEIARFVDSVAGKIEADFPPTPYDNQVAIWHWRGAGTQESSHKQFAQAIRSRAPNITQIWVKTHDGAKWMGDFDSGPLAIRGEASIDEWVSALEAQGLEFHAWCVVHGLKVAGEAEIISAVCNRPGVKSLVLDVEPFEGFWEGGREAIRPLMMQVRRSIPDGFHIGLAVDPRKAHFKSVFPDDWFPFVDSVHPMTYWKTFRRPPDEVLEEVYQVWGDYGRPIIPILQGNAAVEEQEAAHNLAVWQYGAKGLSWWRYGVISQWSAVNLPIELQSDPAEPVTEPGDYFAEEQLITPDSKGFRKGTYTGREEFKSFTGTWNWQVFYKETKPAISEVWAEWQTKLPASGRYEIAAFMPGRHATTRKARYKVHGIEANGGRAIVEINQSRYRNQWVSLGVFDLKANAPGAGKVFLNDLTGEPDREIAFDAIRLRRVVEASPDSGPLAPGRPRPSVINGVYVSDGYDPPIGTPEERRGEKLWPPEWRDAAPFAKRYLIGTKFESFHTGADLNWGRRPNDDMGLPVFACANGVVTFAGRIRVGTWGNVVIVRHDPLYEPGGVVLYSRYAHLSAIRAEAGERIRRGDEIGAIGDADGVFSPHLHFDLSPTTILETKPNDWPGLNLTILLRNYVDPKEFIGQSRP